MFATALLERAYKSIYTDKENMSSDVGFWAGLGDDARALGTRKAWGFTPHEYWAMLKQVGLCPNVPQDMWRPRAISSAASMLFPSEGTLECSGWHLPCLTHSRLSTQ